MSELTKERHKVVKEYARLYSNCNKTGIARLLIKDHPLLFEELESTRNMIRYITGNKGIKEREFIKDKSMVKETKIKNIWGLNKQDKNDIKPYKLPKSSKRVGIISDVHIPYADAEATALALDWLKDRDIDTLILNGDIVDFYQASSFTRDPGKRDLKYELDAAREFLRAVRKNFPKALIVFHEGNHEFRWKRFLMLKAPEVFNMSEFQMDIILQLPSLDIKWVDNKKIIKAGKLNILHGHEYYGTYSPVNPAKGVYNKAQTNVIIGHNHQTSSHISKDLNDEITGAWSTGCLCELNPEYMPYNKWNLGFAYVKLEDRGRFKVINKTIIDGEID